MALLATWDPAQITHAVGPVAVEGLAYSAGHRAPARNGRRVQLLGVLA